MDSYQGQPQRCALPGRACSSLAALSVCGGQNCVWLTAGHVGLPARCASSLKSRLAGDTQSWTSDCGRREVSMCGCDCPLRPASKRRRETQEFRCGCAQLALSLQEVGCKSHASDISHDVCPRRSRIVLYVLSSRIWWTMRWYYLLVRF